MAIDVEEVAVRSGSTADWAASSLVPTAGSLVVDTTTKGIRVADGTSEGDALTAAGGERRGRATLVGGAVTVALTSVTATTIIQLTPQTLGTVAAPKAVGVTARSNGVSFTITSADATDTSVVGWVAYEV